MGAVGIALAMISMLTVLPALLAITGRNAFWAPGRHDPSHRPGGVDETHGFWRRVGDRVARPRTVWITGSIVLALLGANVLAMNTNQTSGDSFRGEVDSVTGQEILARNFPAGASAPTNLIVDPAQVEQVAQKAREFGEVRPGARSEQAVQLSLTLNDAPYSTAALDTIPRLREAVGDDVLVGGPTAEEYDLREAATRDNWLIIPLTLLVVFGILVALLRALVAPLLLMASVVLSFAAALGAGVLVSDYVFGFSGFGPTCRCSRSCSWSRSASTTTSS